MGLLLRRNASDTLTIDSMDALSDAANLSRLSSGVVHMPSFWTAASIGFKVASSLAGTYLPLYDVDGNLVEISSPAADRAYALPSELAGCSFVKLWSQTAGVDVVQLAQRLLVVDGKS